MIDDNDNDDDDDDLCPHLSRKTHWGYTEINENKMNVSWE